MMIIKVKTNDNIIGCVDVESWANPRTQILDFIDENGYSKPVYKDELKFIKAVEF